MRILGLDPGTAICGYGVIDVTGLRTVPVAYGAIRTPKERTAAERLHILYDDVQTILRTTQPDCVGVEELFFSKNVTTGIAVGQARGVLLLAIAQAGLPVYEYTPMQIKQAVTGYGKASKEQVTHMTMRLLGITERIRPDDTADALAVALCTAFRGGVSRGGKEENA